PDLPDRGARTGRIRDRCERHLRRRAGRGRPRAGGDLRSVGVSTTTDLAPVCTAGGETPILPSPCRSVPHAKLLNRAEADPPHLVKPLATVITDDCKARCESAGRSNRAGKPRKAIAFVSKEVRKADYFLRAVGSAAGNNAAVVICSEE